MAQTSIRILGKVIPLPWAKPIGQVVSWNVVEHWIPTGFSSSLVLPKLDFKPKIGDLIEFGDSMTCYTIISLDTIVNPYVMILDRPLEAKVPADSRGFVTAPIRLRERWDGGNFFSLTRREILK